MRHIDIHTLADGARFNRFHAGILAWCALIIICDGYDLAVAGIALPSIMKEMGVTAQNAGFMVSSALFSVFTAAAGLSSDPYVFSAMRFLAGLGIGGVMPNVVAQMTEYSPRRIRATMVTLMFSGYAVGGMLAALLGKGLIEQHGWQSVFLAAGVPVLLIPFILKSLPESMPFLVRRHRLAELQRTLARMEPSYRAQAGDRFDLPAADRVQGAPIGQLFQDSRGFSTAMFWIAFFMCLFMVYALSSWLARLMAGAGYSLGSALTFVLVLNFGAILAPIVIGTLVGMALPLQQNFQAMAIPAVIAAVSVALIRHGRSASAVPLHAGAVAEA